MIAGPMIDDTLLRLDRKALWLFYLQAASRFVLFWVPVVSFTTAATVLSMDLGMYPVYAGILWLFFVFVMATWMPLLAWRRYGYALREHDLLIVHGVLVRSFIAIPTDRIQHVDVRQGPLEQWLGLARLQVHTASGVGGDGSIPGLQLLVAEELRDRLVDIEGDDGV